MRYPNFPVGSSNEHGLTLIGWATPLKQDNGRLRHRGLFLCKCGLKFQARYDNVRRGFIKSCKQCKIDEL